MKTKRLTPRNAAPVKRSNVATVAHDSSAMIAPQIDHGERKFGGKCICPFAGDDAE